MRPLGCWSLIASSLAFAGCASSPAIELAPTQPQTTPETGPPRAPFWSLVAPTRPVVPEVEQADWEKTPIDAFVLEKLEAAGLTPTPQAEPNQLLRRLSLDLTGLPPSVADLSTFAADPSEAAYAAQVERLLAEPAFGEQRGRYWLDLARYADTHGYHFDNYRSIWPYRDYVIGAFAASKPFDVFTIEQLAGDLLPNATVEQRTATGFIRSAMSSNESGIEDDEYAAMYAKDRVDTLATTWLGLTVGCAACHDHRYDPITQKDFYGLAAFFRNSTQPVKDGNAADAPPSILVPPALAPTLVTEERAGDAVAYVLERGRYDAPGELVHAAVPASLPQLAEDEPHNRLGLARWLTRADQPLMARVVVNRFWAELFGAGLVRSASDFGRSGAAPSHPALLDWLAVEFRESGWDVKHLFRLMVSSATYRQSAQISPDRLAADADNRLLSHGPRFRMDAEMIRDLALAASGLLVRTMGGPSVKPYQPPNVWEVVSLPESDTASYTPDSADALYRRSIYTFWKRQAPLPALEIFNAPSREQSVAQRERTNTPLQALVTLNDVQFVEAARVLATHALEFEATTAGRIDYMALRVLGRPETPAERAVLSQLLAAELAIYTGAPAAAQELIHVGASQPPTGGPAAPELAAWTLVANTLLNLDEALSK